MSSLDHLNNSHKLRYRYNSVFSFRQFRFVSLLSLFLILNSVLLFAQDYDDVDPMPLKLKGQVLNLDDESPVPYAFVMNYRTHTGVTTDEQGRFARLAADANANRSKVLTR